MAESSDEFKDDFDERVTKKCRQSFRDRVIPTHILPYLECLSKIDVEYVTAQQLQLGNTLAADLLFDRVRRKRNWFRDLVTALREPNIGLGDLADEFESLIKTIPARWDIVGFEDRNGSACFNGNCLIKDPDKTIRDAIEQEESHVEEETFKKEPYTEHASVTIEDEDNFKKRREEIAIRREELKIRFMEKLYGFVTKPDDVPVIIKYMEKINLQITGIEKGSILFNIYVRSMADLENLQNFWRYGGLKKMLDKELLSYEKVKLLEEISMSHNSPVTNIVTSVTIYEPDFERSKSWLQQERNDTTAAVQIVDGMIFVKQEAVNDIKCRVSKYVHQRLPQCLRKMTDDPFVLERIHTFYELHELREKMDNEARHITNEPCKSVAELFLTWFSQEMTIYLKSMESNLLLNLFRIAGLTFLSIQKHKTSYLPVSYETIDQHYFESQFAKLENRERDRVVIEILLKEGTGLLSCISVPSSVLIEQNEVDNICTRLTEKEILQRDQYGYRFVSAILKDVFLVRFVPIALVIKPEFDINMYPFLLQMYGLHDVTFRNVAVHHENIFYAITKQPEFALVKAVTTRNQFGHLGTYTVGETDFYIPDMVEVNHCSMIDMEGIANEAKKMVMVKSIRKGLPNDISVDLSKQTYGEFDGNSSFMAALQWLNILDSVSETRLAQFCSHNKLSKQHTIQPRQMETKAILDNTKEPVKAFSILQMLKTTARVNVESIHDEIGDNQMGNRPAREIAVHTDQPITKTEPAKHSSNQENVSTVSALEQSGSITAHGDRGKIFVSEPNNPTTVQTFQNMQFRTLNVSGQRLNKLNIHILAQYVGVTTSLSDLVLQDCALERRTIKACFETGHFENITHINVSDNHNLGSLSSESFGIKYLINLECLEIQNCNLCDAGIAKMSADLRYLRKLKGLNVANNSISAEGLLELSAALMLRTDITNLLLQQNALGVQGSMVLASWLRRLVLLEVLNISECEIGDVGISYIASSIASRVVRQLSIDNNAITGYTFFTRVHGLAFLGQFNFSGNTIFQKPEISGKDFESHNLSQTEMLSNFLQRPDSWSEIYLSKCGLGYRRIFTDVQQYLCLKDLTFLCLQDNFITDIFVDDLAICIKAYCRLLVFLDLAYNQIGDNGAVALASSITDSRVLEELHLHGNEIGNRGTEALVKQCSTLPAFQKLDVSCNKLVESAEEALIDELRVRVTDISVLKDETQHSPTTFFLIK